MGRHKIAVIPGDGIGPEVVEAAIYVLESLHDVVKGLKLDFMVVEAGDAALKKYGKALPDDTLRAIVEEAEACLKGPVGESAADVIVKLRLLLDLYANVRPFKAYPGVPCLNPSVDFVIVRENTEDVYKGWELEVVPSEVAVCLRPITRRGSMRIAEYAFKLAEQRARRKVTAVHKANVMRVTDGLFAKCCREVALRHPSVVFEEMYVDTCAMQLVRRPEEFDVIVTTNMFGDILSDEAAAIVGGLGLAPAANIGERRAIFEPVHGSAPKYAGKGVANPCATILAARMMLGWLGEDEAALRLERAVEEALRAGEHLTPDLGGSSSTMELAKDIARRLSQ
ncbi:MAG: isocitrate/isopropylmalate dehydrogenase family protein [Candidatus Nezhaarchaeota archaeon]|nr:isocitrate/isopropylmalate dehydrogenase family protein [Candidatus Nezhaarchaeota archaeon]